MPAGRFPHAATRVAYHPFPRYTPGDDAYVEVVDRPLALASATVDLAALAVFLERAFGDGAQPEQVRTSTYLPGARVEELVGEAAGAAGWTAYGATVDLPLAAGRRWLFEREGEQRAVALLSPGTVLNFRDLTRPIQAGVDTVIGVTGFEAFREEDFDTFLERPGGGDPDGPDVLVLISGSSKDYEFKRVLTLLGRLVRLQEDAAGADEAVSWLREFHEQGRAFMRDVGEDADVETRTQQLTSAIRLHKEVWPNVGLRYRITYRGRPKELVLLANGFVINFFAHYEKGVKTEYIDPIVTMQLLAVARFTHEPVPVGVHPASAYLDEEDVARLWEGLEGRCRPLDLR